MPPSLDSSHASFVSATSTPQSKVLQPNPPAMAYPSANASTAGSWNAKLKSVDVRTAACMALNFFSSTLLVVMNKTAMDNYGFKFASTLTCFHLCCTFFCLLIAAKLGVFEIKRLPVREVAKLAAGTMGFITLTNLSLQHNSIGFYQVMKVMTTPTVVIIEALLYQKYLDTMLKMSLVPVCLGVIFTTVTDFRLNLIGTGYAVAGVIVTSFYQIWSGTLQRSLDCNGLQLQTYVAPLAALFLLPFIPILDRWRPADPESIWYYNFNANNLAVIGTTGLFGFLVNISIFLVIGRSSPLSYNILGHCKTAVVLLSDYILFDRPFTVKSTAGIVLTLIGVFWYTNLKLEKARIAKEAKERVPSPKLTDVKQDILNEEKIDLLATREE